VKLGVILTFIDGFELAAGGAVELSTSPVIQGALPGQMKPNLKAGLVAALLVVVNDIVDIKTFKGTVRTTSRLRLCPLYPYHANCLRDLHARIGVRFEYRHCL
jgi:hypothetical protein